VKRSYEEMKRLSIDLVVTIMVDGIITVEVNRTIN